MSSAAACPLDAECWPTIKHLARGAPRGNGSDAGRWPKAGSRAYHRLERGSALGRFPLAAETGCRQPAREEVLVQQVKERHRIGLVNDELVAGDQRSLVQPDFTDVVSHRLDVDVLQVTTLVDRPESPPQAAVAARLLG